MFSSFPDGWSGAGLLLLRIGAGVVFFGQTVAWLHDWNNPSILPMVGSLLAACVGTLLAVGFLTRFAAGVAASIVAANLLALFSTPLLGSRTAAALVAVIVVAIACLGAGAFSLDARFFGRREIIIPRATPDA